MDKEYVSHAISIMYYKCTFESIIEDNRVPFIVTNSVVHTNWLGAKDAIVTFKL